MAERSKGGQQGGLGGFLFGKGHYLGNNFPHYLG
jgi:hypothetical protein